VERLVARKTILTCEFGVIFLLFFLSVLIRYPDLDRHLVKKQAWVTAQTMIALENWKSQGALKHHFCILQSYPLKADKYISNMGRSMDNNGNWYYTTFPPFAVICPYLVFKIFCIPVNVTNLQTFNLATHLVATLFLYLTVSLVLPQPSSQRINIPAMLASVLFIFMPTNLWTYGNVYSWDIFCHPLWIIGIFLTIMCVKSARRDQGNLFLLALLGAVNFLMVYTEYLGLFSAISVFLFAFLHRKESKQFRWIYRSIAITTVLSLLLTLFQYSQIDGLGSLLRVYIDKYTDVNVSSVHRLSLMLFLYWYKISFLPGIILLIVLLVAAVVFRLPKGTLRLTPSQMYLIYFALLPVVLHHAVFFAWTCHHYYGVLKSSVLISVMPPILLSKLLSAMNRQTGRLFLGFLSVVILALGYQSFRLYKWEFARGENEGHYEAGLYIRAHSRPDQTIFADWWPHPQEVFHSMRNIQVIRDVAQAITWLEEHGRREGVLFYGRTSGAFNSIDKIDRYATISVRDDESAEVETKNVAD
jgi:hypothetical protein